LTLACLLQQQCNADIFQELLTANALDAMQLAKFAADTCLLEPKK
jgi:hypothetical protein